MTASLTNISNHVANHLRTLNGADAPRYREAPVTLFPEPRIDIATMSADRTVAVSRGTGAVTEGQIDAGLWPLVKSISHGQRLFHFVEKAKASGEITHETGETAWKTWRLICETISQHFTVPDASYGPNGQFLFLWDKGEHHLELEIDPDEGGYFFYRNRISGAFWDNNYQFGEQLSSAIIEKLEIFA